MAPVAPPVPTPMRMNAISSKIEYKGCSRSTEKTASQMGARQEYRISQKRYVTTRI